jgi:hypothetical protein
MFSVPAFRKKLSSGFVYNPTISADTNNYDMRAAAVSAGWDQVLPLLMTVTVNAGVVIGSTSTGSYSFDTGITFPSGSLLALVNNGKVLGKGGLGGNGAGSSYLTAENNATAGAAGGPALRAQHALSITNNDTVGGGGGGGGGGGSAYIWDEACGPIVDIGASGAGGGSGQGSTTTSGGSGGSNTLWAEVDLQGPAGGSGTAASAGAGGIGPSQAPNLVGATSGSGGAGGTLGAAGVGGDTGNTQDDCGGATSGTNLGATFGAAGACTAGNVNITWTVAGTRLGALL